MSLVFRLLVWMCLLPLTALCQQRIVKTMAGPNDDGSFRIAVAFMDATDDSYKLQSLMVTVNRTKNKNELPTEYFVDLTTTTRSLTTGAKNQKILVFRWEKVGEREVKCDGGKWAKQAADPGIDKIVETVNAVVKSSPRDAKEPVDFILPKELEQSLSSILEGLETSKLQCVRTGS